MSGHSTDFLEGARDFLLSAGDEETGSSHSVIGTTSQLLLLMDLLEQSLTTILVKNKREGLTGEKIREGLRTRVAKLTKVSPYNSGTPSNNEKFAWRECIIVQTIPSILVLG